MDKNKKSKFEEYTSNIDNKLLQKWKDEQNLLKTKLIEVDDLQVEDVTNIRKIGGMDISASKLNPEIAVVALVVCDAENFKVIYEKYEFVTITQPYVPGFLAFREVEHLVKLINELKLTNPELLPQVILTDGNGILHSNRFGLACHLGVLSDIPTVGCGKTVFSVDGINKMGVKQAAKNLQNGGEFFYLKGISGDVWGAALRCTDKSSDPIIVNIGHKICLDTAINIVRKCCLFRVPEPVRIADKRSRVLIKEFENKKDVFDIEEFMKNSVQDYEEDK